MNMELPVTTPARPNADFHAWLRTRPVDVAAALATGALARLAISEKETQRR